MANKGLTIKQERYVQGLFAGLSQREAYKQAYDCSKWSDNAIDVEASNLYNNPKIVLRVKELTDELKGRNMVTVERLLAEYAKIGFADIKDFLEFGTERAIVGYDDDGNPVFGYKQVVKARPSSEVDGSLINEVSISPKGVFSFKLHDKKGALDSMSKHLGMFIDKIEAKNINENHNYDSMTTEQLEQELEKLGYKKA